MKNSEVIQRVRTLTGDRTALQYSDDDVIAWINDGVRECAVINNLLQKTATQQTTIGQASYSLPTDMLKLHSVKLDGFKLREITQAQFDDLYASGKDNPEANPDVCYIWAGSLNLYPVPDGVKELRIDYLYEPQPIINDPAHLDANVALPVGYHSRIVDYCIAQVFLQDGDATGYATKLNEFRTGVADLKDQPEDTYDEYPGISTSFRDM